MSARLTVLPGRAASRRRGVRGAPSSVARTARQPAAVGLPSAGAPADAIALLFLVGVLSTIGLVMVLSASSVEALAQYGSPWVFFEHQVIYLVAGAGALLVAARLDYRRWRRFTGALVVGCSALLLAVLVPHVGVSVDGSTRWIGAGILRVQPSELAKFALAAFGADVLARRGGEGRPWGPAVRPVLIASVVMAVLVVKQPDMGTAMVLACIALGLIYAAGAPMAKVWSLLGAGGLLAVVVAVAEPYRRARLLSFVDPWAHRSGSGYQVVQALVGFANGRFLGVGLGASTAKWGFLPNAHTDFIFAIIGEELGLVGSLLVVGLFVALVVFGLRIAARSDDRFGSLLAGAIVCWIASQTVLNMGAVIGLLPVTGVPLPFVSYGGSSLVIEMAAVGVLVSVARARPAAAPAPPGARRAQRRRA